MLATTCPLCGAENLCAMERERVTGEKQPECWCMRTDFTDGVLDRIPESLRNLSCICEACATAQNTTKV